MQSKDRSKVHAQIIYLYIYIYIYTYIYIYIHIHLMCHCQDNHVGVPRDGHGLSRVSSKAAMSIEHGPHKEPWPLPSPAASLRAWLHIPQPVGWS